jgi:hypothetical protein
MKRQLQRTGALTALKVVPAILAALGVAYLWSGLLAFVTVLTYLIVRVRREVKENYHEPLNEKYERLRNSPPPHV